MATLKQLSSWAKNHKWTARLLIVAAFILLDILGVLTGMLLNDLTITFHPLTFYFFLILFFVAIGLYPDKSMKGTVLSKHSFYIRQKSCDLILAGTTYLMLVCISNGNSILGKNYFATNASVKNSTLPITDSTKKRYKSIAAFSASMKDEKGKLLKWKDRKKLLKEQLSEIKKANDISKGGKLALLILCSLIAGTLLLLIVGWSCTLSCSGSDGAALLVGIGGTAAVVFLMILASRLIYGKRKKEKNIKEAEKPESEIK